MTVWRICALAVLFFVPPAGAQTITQDVVIEGPGGTGDSRGITWYQQPADPAAPWIAHGMGASYRDVHEISLGEWLAQGSPGHTGVRYVLVAEQEQACDPARPEGRPPSHPGVEGDSRQGHHALD